MQIDELKKWARSHLGRALLSLCLLVGLSGCWAAPNAATSAEYGAAAGGLVGGEFGCSLAYSFASSHDEGTAFAIGCPAGVAAALL
jgi:hypothetical protein